MVYKEIILVPAAQVVHIPPHVPPPQSSVSRPCPHPLLRVGRAGRAVKDCGRFFAILLIVAYLRREGGFHHPPTELLLRSGLLKVEA